MIDKIAQLLETRLWANWSETLIAWDNVEFIPMRGTAYIAPVTDINAAATIGGTSTGALDRSIGLFKVSVFTPSLLGSRYNLSLCSIIAGIYRGYEESGLYCEAPYLTYVGNIEEWYQTDVTIPLFYEDCTIPGAIIRLNLSDSVQAQDHLNVFIPASLKTIDIQDEVSIEDSLVTIVQGGYGGGGYGEGTYGGQT